MAGTWSRSSQLVRESWNVLKQDRSLVWFPIISGLAGIALILSFLLPLVAVRGANAIDVEQIPVALLFVFYLALSFIGSFFTAGLMTIVFGRFRGERLTFADGLRNAVRHVGTLFLWSLVAATVGVLLRLLERKGGLVGKVVSMLGGLAWSVLTVFVVPVLIFERQSLGAAVRQSGALFKKTWGENAVASVTLGLFFFALYAIGFFGFGLLAFAIGQNSGLAGFFGFFVLTYVPYVVIVAVIHAALSGVFQTSLYYYASTGTMPPGFTPELIRGGYLPKRGGPTASVFPS